MMRAATFPITPEGHQAWAAHTAGPAWGDLCSRYAAIAQRESYVRANQFITRYQPLIRGDLYLAGGDDHVRDFAEAKAKECALIIATRPTLLIALGECQRLIDQYGPFWPAPCSPITGPSVDLMPLTRRLTDPAWWRRQVRRLQAREVDQLARRRKQVAKYRQAYVADWVVGHRRRAERRNATMLERSTAINEADQEYSLAELAEVSVSNPEIRRAELMTRMRGFEEVANDYGHVGEFWTLTSASRFHAMRWIKKAKKAVGNRKWNGFNPRQTQDHLCNVWARIRSALNRAGIRFYGFRVVEPHHDGTPHWHLLVFMRREHRAEARRICREYALMVDPNEKGARTVRFTAKAIDPSKGTAAGYIAKYVAKNVDGRGVHGALQMQDDETGLDFESGAERVRAWATTWGIRQFQQVGGPSVTVWRELRRLWSSLDDDADTGDLFGNPMAEAAGEAADAGDWAAYVMAMGGPNMPRKDRPAAPAYEEGRETRYGDDTVKQIFGLCARFGRTVVTRIHQWTVEYRPPVAPVVERVERSDDALIGEPSPRWMRHIAGLLLQRGSRAFAPPAGGALDLCQ